MNVACGRLLDKSYATNPLATKQLGQSATLCSVLNIIRTYSSCYQTQEPLLQIDCVMSGEAHLLPTKKDLTCTLYFKLISYLEAFKCVSRHIFFAFSWSVLTGLVDFHQYSASTYASSKDCHNCACAMVAAIYCDPFLFSQVPFLHCTRRWSCFNM